MAEPEYSASVGVHCSACGADLGDQYKPGDGLALFKARVPNCPKNGETEPDARTSPPSHAREVTPATIFGLRMHQLDDDTAFITRIELDTRAYGFVLDQPGFTQTLESSMIGARIHAWVRDDVLYVKEIR